MKPLIIGLHNPHSQKPSHALLPWPANATGARLVEAMQLVDSSVTVDDYLDAFDRVNLWDGMELPTGRGRRSLLDRNGRKLLALATREPRSVVLLGIETAACVLNRRTPIPWFTSVERDGSTFWSLPHPSGLNRIYNQPENRERAGRILLEVSHDHRPDRRDPVPGLHGRAARAVRRDRRARSAAVGVHKGGADHGAR